MAQAIPFYCIGAFMLPSTLGDEFQKMLNYFWWGSSNKKGKMYKMVELG